MYMYYVITYYNLAAQRLHLHGIVVVPEQVIIMLIDVNNTEMTHGTHFNDILRKKLTKFNGHQYNHDVHG